MNMRNYFVSLWCLMASSCAFGVNQDFFNQFFSPKQSHPFSYNLGVKLIRSEKNNADYMICCHGSGANNQIADIVKSFNVTQDNLISFNFPDYNTAGLGKDLKTTVFGTIAELLPPLYLIKKCVVDGCLDRINLYGFSAGGAVIVNIIALLSNDRFADELLKVGITSQDKQKMLSALSKGVVILDCPLKSIEEIAAIRGNSHEFDCFAERYKENNMRPIDVIKTWHNIKFTILLHFQKPDEILGNQDDELFIQRVKQYNHGTTHVVTGYDGGHNSYHKSLWDLYKRVTAQST